MIFTRPRVAPASADPPAGTSMAARTPLPGERRTSSASSTRYRSTGSRRATKSPSAFSHSTTVTAFPDTPIRISAMDWTSDVREETGLGAEADQVFVDLGENVDRCATGPRDDLAGKANRLTNLRRAGEVLPAVADEEDDLVAAVLWVEVGLATRDEDDVAEGLVELLELEPAVQSEVVDRAADVHVAAGTALLGVDLQALPDADRVPVGAEEVLLHVGDLSADDLDLGEIHLAEARVAGDPDGGDFDRLVAHARTSDRVDGDRVGAGDDEAHLDGEAGVGALALHPDDRIDDGQIGLPDPELVHDLLVDVVPVLALLVGVEALAVHAVVAWVIVAQDALPVRETQRDGLRQVVLQLRDVDDHVRVEERLPDVRLVQVAGAGHLDVHRLVLIEVDNPVGLATLSGLLE